MGLAWALTIVSDFGDSGAVRSAVLGGVYGPEANALQVPVGLAERLDLLFDACAADRACNGQYGDLRATLKNQLARSASQPEVVLVQDSRSNATLSARADQTALLEGLLDALGNSDSIAGVPALLNGLAHADNTLLVNGIKARLQELDSLAWGMNAAIQCQEEFLLSSPDDQAAVMAAVRPGYEGLALRFPESSSALPIWCAKEEFQARPTREKQPVSSEMVPVLAISGLYDPFTPPEWADRATAGFSIRYLYTLPYAGHDTAVASSCAIRVVSAFIADPGHAPDGACVGQPPAPSFVLP